MILFKAEAVFASSISKLWNFLPATDRDDFNSSIEPTISTSLIHTIASDRKSEQVVTWLLNLFFQHKNDDGLGIELCGTSTSIKELMVDGLLANVGIGIGLPILSYSLATVFPVPMSARASPVVLGVAN